MAVSTMTGAASTAEYAVDAPVEYQAMEQIALKTVTTVADAVVWIVPIVCPGPSKGRGDKAAAARIGVQHER
eukprot:5148566-Karenia_brevis.AAC.1